MAGRGFLGIDRDIVAPVAGHTTGGESGVVHACRCKSSEIGMAVIAIGGPSGRDVGRRLGQRNRCAAIVTGRAAPGGSRIMDVLGSSPGGSGLVTGIALRSGGNVIDALGLRIGKQETPVMAGGAFARRTAVVHARRRKSRGVEVAGVALRSRRNVIGGLGESG